MTAAESPLTDGQVDVLRYVADGCSYAEAGTALGITEAAAKSRCARAAETLGTRHIAHTVAVAGGLVDDRGGQHAPHPDQQCDDRGHLGRLRG